MWLWGTMARKQHEMANVLSSNPGGRRVSKIFKLFLTHLLSGCNISLGFEALKKIYILGGTLIFLMLCNFCLWSNLPWWPNRQIFFWWGWTTKEIEFSLLFIYTWWHCLTVSPHKIFPWRFSYFLWWFLTLKDFLFWCSEGGMILSLERTCSSIVLLASYQDI